MHCPSRRPTPSTVRLLPSCHAQLYQMQHRRSFRGCLLYQSSINWPHSQTRPPAAHPGRGAAARRVTGRDRSVARTRQSNLLSHACRTACFPTHRQFFCWLNTRPAHRACEPSWAANGDVNTPSAFARGITAQCKRTALVRTAAAACTRAQPCFRHCKPSPCAESGSLCHTPRIAARCAHVPAYTACKQRGLPGYHLGRGVVATSPASLAGNNDIHSAAACRPTRASPRRCERGRKERREWL
jgi:hypothetical protein